jgi:hypothetical protein
MENQSRIMDTVVPKGTRREWIGLAVLAWPCLI